MVYLKLCLTPSLVNGVVNFYGAATTNSVELELLVLLGSID